MEATTTNTKGAYHTDPPPPDWSRLHALEPELRPFDESDGIDLSALSGGSPLARFRGSLWERVYLELCAMAAVRWLLHEKPEWSLCWTGNTWCVWNTPDSGPPGPIVAEDRSLAHALFAAVEAVIRSRGVVPPPTAPAG